MHNRFRQYYRPTDDEFKALWKNALVVFDTSALLGFYRNSASFVDEALAILDAIAGRLWLPHQVALEYHENLSGVETALFTAQQETRKCVNESVRQLRAQVYANRHPFLRDEMLKRIERFEIQAEQLLNRKEANDNHLLKTRIKSIRTKLDSTFTSVGEPYAEETLTQVYSEGEVRYKKRIPPGFEDEKKPTAEERFGDLVAWKQMLDQAKATGRPIILVTDDRKQDWWLIKSGRTFGPHPLLREEMYRVAGQDYYSYTIEQFVERGVPEFLQRAPQQAATDDARVSEQAETAWLLDRQMLSEGVANAIVNHSEGSWLVLRRIYEQMQQDPDFLKKARLETRPFRGRLVRRSSDQPPEDVGGGQDESEKK